MRNIVELEKTAANSDCLADTDLKPIPFAGILTIWAGSTVNTATAEVNQDGHKAGNTILLRKENRWYPYYNPRPPIFSAPVPAGAEVTVLGGTTGTCHITAILQR